MDNNAPVTYCGRPIVRCGNEMYYGNMTDKYITLLKILATKKVGDSEIATKVSIQMLYTDPDIKGKSKIVKSSEKDSMSVALELAAAWLDRA